jgi:hypothetical chaperone protein
LSFSLYDEIDRVKRILSVNTSDTLKFIEDHININVLVERSEFESYIKEEMRLIDEKISEALQISGLSSEDIEAVATTGGSSLIPAVRNLLIKKFGMDKIIESDAFTSVAAGLAIRAKELFN